MNNRLFYTTRSVSGREGKSIVEHIKILESDMSTVDFLNMYKTIGPATAICDHIDLRVTSVNLFGEYYQTKAKLLDDWMQIYDDLDVSALQKYDSLHLIGGLDLWRSNLTRTSNRVGKFPRDSGQIKFESVATHLVNILALLKAHREYGIPLHEIAFDPNEMAMNLFHTDVAVKDNYHVYHGYDIPKYGIKRLDSLQYYLSNKIDTSLFGNTDKIYDFTFGYTVLEKSGREKFIRDVDEAARQWPMSNLYMKNDAAGTNTLLNRDLYLDTIAASRFTYMLPSYDQHCFSIYRFLEAIHNDCLPLVHRMCNVQDVQKSYDVHLTYLIDRNITEHERQDLLQYYKSKMLSVEKLFVI